MFFLNLFRLVGMVLSIIMLWGLGYKGLAPGTGFYYDLAKAGSDPFEWAYLVLFYLAIFVWWASEMAARRLHL